MDNISALRKKHPIFSYESFDYKLEDDSLVISFFFKIHPNIKFNPQIRIEKINTKIFSQIEKKVLENFIFNLGLVEMISYWKATCSPKIEIKAGFINQQQKEWWKNLLLKGLGEFFYQNRINFKQANFIEIEDKSANIFAKDTLEHQGKYLILNGGGKDSAVTLETVKEMKKDCTVMMLNPTVASLELTNLSGIKNSLIVKREIGGRLIELNSKGYLNGHTPFSAYLAFLSLICALVLDYKYIVVSNENSSNEGNINYLKEKINHQYSKSFEFEKAFREYVSENLSEHIEYFSVLRPLYELQISRLFSNFPKYFEVFKSCNKGQKENKWCGDCAKCLSTYITLYPFIDEAKLKEIFKNDLYSKSELRDLLLYMTGVKQPKPFECIGTSAELKECLRLSIDKIKIDSHLPPLLLFAQQNILKNKLDKHLLAYWDKSNFLPQDISKLLKAKINNEN